MTKIQVCTAGNVQVGEYVVQADSDDYGLGTFVDPEDYNADEQDWQHVVAIGGHADVGWMILAMYNGEQYRVDGDWYGTVWRRTDDEGVPAHQDPAERD